jgi:hypothetical protein
MPSNLAFEVHNVANVGRVLCDQGDLERVKVAIRILAEKVNQRVVELDGAKYYHLPLLCLVDDVTFQPPRQKKEVHTLPYFTEQPDLKHVRRMESLYALAKPAPALLVLPVGPYPPPYVAQNSL